MKDITSLRSLRVLLLLSLVQFQSIAGEVRSEGCASTRSRRRSFSEAQCERLSRLLANVPLGYSICKPADDSSTTKNGTKVETHSKSSSHGSAAIGILIAVVTLVLLTFFLYKLWQKKKREEQYARLLKLFEEDDELEVELGLRD